MYTKMQRYYALKLFINMIRKNLQARQNTQSKMKEFIVRINYCLSGEKMQVCPCPLLARY